MKELGSYLSQKRLEAGLSQRNVSDHLGYSTPQFVSNWERGVSHPPIGQIKSLAKLYKIDAEEVFKILLKETLKEVEADLRQRFEVVK
ncbi:MAG: helix-turn-helix transcriptional regulator [Bdellovibrio sp.]